MFTHNGCITTRFFPTKSHGALGAADLESTTLAPLAPYVDKILLPRGIRAMNEWTATMERGQGNDHHLQVVGSYFTCQPVTPNSNDPFTFDPATKSDAMPVGPSLDHVMAEQLSPDGSPLFVRVGNRKDGPYSAISYSAAQTPHQGLGTPGEILTSLTGLFQGGAMSPDTYQAIRGKSVLDLVKDDLETLQRFDMSQSDSRKLEAWKELLNQTTGILASPQCNAEVAALLGATQENVDASAMGLGIDPLTARITEALDGADIYSNVAALAAICNLSPVIFLKYPASYTFSGLGLDLSNDVLAHRSASAILRGACLEGVIDMLLTIDRYYASKFTHLVELLTGIDEGDGKVLDNVAAVWFQENSDGCAMNLNNLPIVQAGSAGGYFKTGWAVNVEDGSADLTRGNSELQCGDGGSNEADAISQATGTDPGLANAPINKYFCNLMNALGVKAGADGFPAKGGAAEVTHYGMYDRTEDFIGGGANPPTIHDPGEFTALRANG